MIELIFIVTVRLGVGVIPIFFFQAEDGIRDLYVTGVQTCALPISIVAAAIRRARPKAADPLGTLAELGGFEIAALVGAALAAAARRVPVVLDGYITTSAALAAVALAPNLRHSLIAAHRSAEPGHRVALEYLGLQPLLTLDMRLGEGSGAALALPIILGAAWLMRDMATFEQAGVDDKVTRCPGH